MYFYMFGQLIASACVYLIGHVFFLSQACIPYPYVDPYFGGILTTYGSHAVVSILEQIFLSCISFS